MAEDVEEPSADVLEYGDEQRALRRKVLVEDGLRDAGGEGEVVHRCRVEAALGELDARDVEQLSTSLVGREAQRSRAAGVGHPLVLDFRGIS